MRNTLMVHRYLPLLLPALLAAALLLYATGVYGPGVDSDSVSYLSAAQNLVERGALVQTFLPGVPDPVTHWPPLYPALLALLYLFDTDAVLGGRVLNAVLLALYVLAIQLLVLRASQNSVRTALLAGLFAALATSILFIYARSWSETLFLVLFLYGMLMLGHYLQRESQTALFAAGVLFALAWLSRYVGIVLLASGGLAILLWSRRTIRLRVRDALLFGLVVAAPMAIVMLRNYLLTDNAVDRHFSFHPVAAEWWRVGFLTLSSWLVPVASPPAVKSLASLLVLTAALAGVVMVFRDWRRCSCCGAHSDRAWVYAAIMLLFSGIYLLFFVAVVTFVDTGWLSGRTLSPVFSALIVVTAYVIHTAMQRFEGTRAVVVAVTLVLIGLLGSHALRSAYWSSTTRAGGLDYNSRAWRESAIMGQVRDLPPAIPLYSNLPELVYLLTDRPIHKISHEQCKTGCGAFETDLRAFADNHQDKPVIVWVLGRGDAACGPCLAALASDYGFRLAAQDEQVQVYEWAVQD